MGNTEGQGPAGRLRRRWEDNIKMDIQEVGYWVMDWIELTQDRDRWRALVCAVIHVPFSLSRIIMSGLLLGIVLSVCTC